MIGGRNNQSSFPTADQDFSHEPAVNVVAGRALIDACRNYGVLPFEQCRVTDNVFSPKLPHYPLHVIGAKTPPIRMLVAKLT
jgi:hypothetical protein